MLKYRKVSLALHSRAKHQELSLETDALGVTSLGVKAVLSAAKVIIFSITIASHLVM